MSEPRRRGMNAIWVVILVAAAVGGLAGWLISEYEYQFSWSQDGPYLLYAAILVIVLASAFIIGSRNGFWRMVKGLIVWSGIGAALVVGYVYRDDLKAMWHRVAGEVDPDHQVSATDSLTLFRARDGHFYMTAWLDGTRMRLLIDTGATTTVLRWRDAQKAGLYPDRLNYNVRVHTGNGVVMAARATVERFEVGAVKMRNLPVLVSRGQSHVSVLGQSALRRFKGYEVTGDRLVLKY